MAYCRKCGTKLDDNMIFCPICGEKTAEGNKEHFTGTVENGYDSSSAFSQDDINKNKGLCILAYISWLVLIPIFAGNNSKFTRFHSNQGLVLALVELAWWIVSSVVNAILAVAFGLSVFRIIYVLIRVLLSLVNVFFLAWSIIGIVNVANGEAKELPIIGNIKILK